MENIKEKKNFVGKIKEFNKARIYTENVRQIIKIKENEKRNTNQIKEAEKQVEDAAMSGLYASKEILQERQRKEYQINKHKKRAEKNKQYAEKAKKMLKESYEKLKKAIESLSISAGVLIMVLMIVVLICGFISSCFGIFFNEEKDNGKTKSMSVQTAIAKLNDEVDEEIYSIQDRVSHNSCRIYKDPINFKHIIAIYSVYTTNRNKEKEIMTIAEKDYEELSQIFWKCIDVDCETERYTVTRHREDGSTYKVSRKRLIITVTCLSLEEMMNECKLNRKEKAQVEEMLTTELNDMWSLIGLGDVH